MNNQVYNNISIIKKMDAQKRMELNQQKQWKQQWKVNLRKVDQNQKSYLKILQLFSEINPQYSQSKAVLSQYENNNRKNQKESTLIFGKLKKVNESTLELKQTLKYFDKTHQSLVKVQKLSEGTFSKMQGLKNQMALSYDELDDLQGKLNFDLQLISKRIDAFQQQIVEHEIPLTKKIKNKQNLPSQNTKVRNPKIQSQMQVVGTKQILIQDAMKEKQKQVECVDEEIRQMGKFLGWHEEDHKDFLAIWNRNHPNKNYFQIQDELVQYFKLYTSEQIIEHMNKYMKLKKLNDKKKNLILEYKQLKQRKKQEQILKIKQSQYENEMKIKKQQENRRIQQEQIEMKQKIEIWKKQKQQSKIIEKQKASENQNKKKHQQTMQKREEQAKRRQILQKWKNEQQQKKQKQSKQAMKRPHSAVNKQTRQRIREREQQLMREKMQKAISKKIQSQQLAKKAQKMKQQKMIKYAYVNSKLDQKTTSVKEKQRQKFDGKQKKDANTFGGQLLLTGVRAIPQWRQGL